MSTEFIVWVFAVLAALVFHLLKAARNRPRPSARVATAQELERREAVVPADEPTPAATPATIAAEVPAETPAPAPMADADAAGLPPHEHHADPLPVEWGRQEPPRPEPAPAPSRRTTGWHPGGRADLAQAVVAMTVLGPCRALAPYGQDESAASAGARTRPAPPAASR